MVEKSILVSNQFLEWRIIVKLLSALPFGQHGNCVTSSLCHGQVAPSHPGMESDALLDVILELIRTVNADAAEDSGAANAEMFVKEA